MRYVKVSMGLIAWYLSAFCLTFFTMRLMVNTDKWLLWIVPLVGIPLAAYLSFGRNFITKAIGRVAMFILLIALLWGGFMSFFYLALLTQGA